MVAMSNSHDKSDNYFVRFIKAFGVNLLLLLIALLVYIGIVALSDWLTGSTWPGTLLVLTVLLIAETRKDLTKAPHES